MSDALTFILTETGLTEPILIIKDEAKPPAVKGRLCLNMIVKNESKIIERLIDSVLSIIDTYCICDTGSTDDTAAIIRAKMEKEGKPGEVYVEPFKNFGYNRSHALDRAAAWGEYALLLDADMKLVIEPGFDKNALTANSYSIIQKNGTLDYYNTRLIKTGIGAKCVGPTHEYYDIPAGPMEKLSTLWINDIGDGGCKSDKFERDIRLLTAALEEDPKNGRYHFYLAQSLNHSGKKQEAYEMYKKRIELGGWCEEIFYAALEAGNMAKELGRKDDAVYMWLEAYNKHPKRSESLYELAKFYREAGKNHLAQIYIDLGKKIPYPKDDSLFIKKACYDYLFDYENSITAYYTKRPIDHYSYLNLLGKRHNYENVLSNYKFYVKKIAKFDDAKKYDFCGKAEKRIMRRNDDFTSSSPCIIPWHDGYLLNVRYVNYKIRPDGGYDFKHNDGKITTLNLLHWLNRDFKILKSKWLDQVQDESLRYQGVEDVKFFQHCDELLFCGTVQNISSGRVAMGHGVVEFDSDKLISQAWASPNGRDCEKNWCYFHTAEGKLRMVYDWSPLTIADPSDPKTLEILSKNSDVPAIFRDLRGSSNGCLLGDEIWFLTHLVQYCTPRHYYHMIVVLDAKTLSVKRHSILFKFDGEGIEYSLGFLVEADRCIFSYSTWDRTSTVLTLPRATVEAGLFA
jgi:glycosyltransferase involved in cell wall biosynthesis